MCGGIKPKRKNSEKRKAKSRDAARVRRSNESDIFRELTELLPLSEKIRATLDKTSVTRLAICYIRLQELIKNELKHNNMGKDIDRRLDALYLKSFGGFLMIIGADGFVTYLSENVSLFLGLSQMDMMAQSVYEFLHVSNHEQMHDILLYRDGKSLGDCCLSLKCTLTSKGHSVNVKSAGYKVMHSSSYRMMKGNYTMFLCKPLLDPLNMEIPLGSHVFVTKHSLDMKFIHTDRRVQEILGYGSDDLLGQSFYNFVYGSDCAQLRTAFVGLVTKGQAVSGMYRMLAATGGYLWVETQSTVIADPRTQKPDCIVCINFAIGGIEQCQTAMNEMQMNTEVLSPMTPDFVLSTSSILQVDTDGICDSTTLSVEPVATSLETDINLYDDILFPESEVDMLAMSEGGAQIMLQMLDKTCLENTRKIPTSVKKSVNNLSSNGAAAVVPDCVQEMDVSLFAPYIPMDSDDILFPQVDGLLTSPQANDNRMLGITESVFGPKPEEEVSVFSNNPVGMLRQASQKKDRMLLGDVTQNVGLPRTKQAIETNRLASGPPLLIEPKSSACVSVQMAAERHITLPSSTGHPPSAVYRNASGLGKIEIDTSAGGSTVLRNLLLSGTDVYNGYTIRTDVKQMRSGKESETVRRNMSLWSMLMGQDT